MSNLIPLDERIEQLYLQKKADTIEYKIELVIEDNKTGKVHTKDVTVYAYDIDQAQQIKNRLLNAFYLEVNRDVSDITFGLIFPKSNYSLLARSTFQFWKDPYFKQNLINAHKNRGSVPAGYLTKLLIKQLKERQQVLISPHQLTTVNLGRFKMNAVIRIMFESAGVLCGSYFIALFTKQFILNTDLSLKIISDGMTGGCLFLVSILCLARSIRDLQLMSTGG